MKEAIRVQARVEGIADRMFVDGPDKPEYRPLSTVTVHRTLFHEDGSVTETPFPYLPVVWKP